MTDSQSLHLKFVPVVFSVFSTLLCPALATSGTDNDYTAHPRFVCTPIPVDADPACLPASPGVGAAGPRGPGDHNAPPAGWWGASEEAKATILHLREGLVQQRETILDQRETIRELTAKLTLCEGLGHGAAPHDEHHGTGSPFRHPGLASHHTDTDKWHYSNQQSHHENHNLIPDSPHSPSARGQHSDGGHSSNNHGKDKHVTPGDTSSSPGQMERLLQVLKERLDNLQKRNTSIAYSNSLKDLLQTKISSLEQQLHRSTAALNRHDHHDEDSSHDHHDDDNSHDHPDDASSHDHPDDDSSHDHHDDDSSHDHHDDDSSHDHHDDDSSHGDDGEHHKADDRHPNDHNDDYSHSGHSDTDHHEDSHKDDHHESDSSHDDHDDGHHEDTDGRHSNEADSHSYFPLTGYRAAGPHADSYSKKLDTLLNQLNLAGSSRRKSKSPDAFQISFPMRTNYMYGRVKRTLLQEIFALTLCLWIKAGVGPGMGTPFSYSAPGQANELVLIEWGNNPMELLIDDKAVTLPLSLGDGKWHHVCVTWSTRDGQWQAYQDGVQRGSGINLSPWHPIKPGGVFILGQEQDTLGGRFDASQSFVGEMSNLHMWSHVLTASDIYSLVSCGSHLRGDVIAWSNTEVELRGGVSSYPFDPCH